MCKGGVNWHVIMCIKSKLVEFMLCYYNLK